MAKRNSKKRAKPLIKKPQYGDLVEVTYLDHVGGWGDLAGATIPVRVEERRFCFYRKKMGKKFLVTARVIEEDGSMRDWDSYLAAGIVSITVIRRARRR